MVLPASRAHRISITFGVQSRRALTKKGSVLPLRGPSQPDPSGLRSSRAEALFFHLDGAILRASNVTLYGKFASINLVRTDCGPRNRQPRLWHSRAGGGTVRSINC